MNIKCQMNILGSIRAESDQKMLKYAFYHTGVYDTLINENNNFSFIVGRRGTGKSALFIKVSEKLKENKKNIVITDFPEESEVLAFKSLLERIGNVEYTQSRAICNLVWQVFIAVKIIEFSSNHYKIEKFSDSTFIQTWKENNFIILKNPSLANILENVVNKNNKTEKMSEYPQLILNLYQLKDLMPIIHQALASADLKTYILMDGLDEGWLPDDISSSVLGGLAYFASKLRDKYDRIQLIAFVRDNMFRTLCDNDPDSSRILEGDSLRIVWTEESLHNLIIKRIREHFNLINKENDAKLWDRLFANELKGRSGFLKILKNTLYRPRDLLVLVNKAHSIAIQAGREKIIEEDIDQTAVQTSVERYKDLLKEYKSVLPGLEDFCEIFRGAETFYDYGDLISKIETVIKVDKSVTKSGEFSIYTDPADVFLALFSVGFVGKFETKINNYLFCHDGSQSNIAHFQQHDKILIHPCYWRALNLRIEEASSDIGIISSLNDEYGEVVVDQNIEKSRHKLIGKIIAEISNIPYGVEVQKLYEDWAFRTIRLLLADNLTKINFRQNEYLSNHKDIIATNESTHGFWKRLQLEYHSHDVLFVIKNYSEITLEDFQNISKSISKSHGNLGFIIKRDTNENLSSKELSLVKKIYLEHGKIIFIISDSFLNRSVAKLRGIKKDSYFEDKLKRRLDDYKKKYLSQAKKQ